jgi:hypothetical protein
MSEERGHGMTGQEMCEFIAEVHERRIGEKIEPRDIWEQSPGGELFPVYADFQAAIAWCRENDVELPQNVQEWLDRRPRAVASENIEVSSGPAEIGGERIHSGDYVLLPEQDDPSENGVWISWGAGRQMVRAELQ